MLVLDSTESPRVLFSSPRHVGDSDGTSTSLKGLYHTPSPVLLAETCWRQGRNQHLTERHVGDRDGTSTSLKGLYHTPSPVLLAETCWRQGRNQHLTESEVKNFSSNQLNEVEALQSFQFPRHLPDNSAPDGLIVAFPGFPHPQVLTAESCWVGQDVMIDIEIYTTREDGSMCNV
ncbi:hypothetical protein RRG08_058647 [Elysia crispata]|uniref:Uncharacterized protein n=1 Tax=Elysia crispata TaxID=231223 RepID=A0AAE1D7T5_9GAST|nr:hypothetical protein RRG08_058647 [Elysia crispata]